MMGYQFIWLVVSHMAVLAVGVLFLGMELYLGFWAAFVGVPAIRVARRFAPGKGYYLLQRQDSLESLATKSVRATREHRPQLFAACVAVEILVLGGAYFAILRRPDFWQMPAVRLVVECHLGSGLSEICF